MSTLPQNAHLSEPKIQTLVRNIAAQMTSVLTEVYGDNFRTFEEVALQVTSEATRLSLESALQTIADQFRKGDRIQVDGHEYKSHLPGQVRVPSLCGMLEVNRYTFRELGIRNGPTIVPMALAAGLVEGATPVFAENVAHAYATRDMRSHREALIRARRAPPSRATMERLATRCGAAACAAPPVLETTLRRTEKNPEGAYAISLGIDRTTVAMVEPRDPEEGAEPRRKRTKPRVRSTPAPINVKYRMAYVATVAIVDEHGDALQVRRYGVPACDAPESELVEGALADVRRALAQNPDLKVGVVQDGAPEMWSLAREGLETLKDEGVLDGWVEAIDWFHLLERLGKALVVVEEDPDTRTQTLEAWKAQLDTKNSAIDDIERQLLASNASLSKAKQASLKEHLTYIENNKDRMRYPDMSANGLPVGSGVTEGAAKTVVGKRAKLGGQQWGEHGLRGVLKLRSIVLSDRFPAYWQKLSQSYEATVVHSVAA